MRVLALADKRPMIDPATMARQRRVDAVFCLGDLDRAWIESLLLLRGIPRYGVHGNHDPEAAQRLMADPAAFIDDALRFLEGGLAALRT